MKKMRNKLKIFGSGNKERRNFFILNKDESFFSLFPIFLIGCGFNDIKEYEKYQEERPDINKFVNRVEHFKNEKYDLDLIYTQDRIILIVRTDPANRDELLAGINKLAEM